MFKYIKLYSKILELNIMFLNFSWLVCFNFIIIVFQICLTKIVLIILNRKSNRYIKEFRGG